MGDQSSTRPTLRHTQAVNQYRQEKTQVGSSSLDITQSMHQQHPKVLLPPPSRCSKSQITDQVKNDVGNSSSTTGASSTSMNPNGRSKANVSEIAKTFSFNPKSANMHTLLEYRAGKLHHAAKATALGADKNKVGKSCSANSTAPTIYHLSGNSIQQHNNHISKGSELEQCNGATLFKKVPTTSSKDARYDQVAINNHINSSKESRFEGKVALSDHLQKVHLGVQNGNVTETEINAQTWSGVCDVQNKSASNQTYSPLAKTGENINQPIHDKINSCNGHMNGHAHRNRSPPQDCPQSQLNRLSEKNSSTDYLSNSKNMKDTGALITQQNSSGQDSIESNLSSSSSSSSTSSRQWQEISALKSDNGIKYNDDDDDDDDSGFFLQENDFDEDTFDEGNSLEASFAGRRNYLMPEKVICGETGTIRGMKNRVRAGIETFHQQTNGKKNFHQLETSKVVVYTTSNGIVRETFQKCLKVKMILSTHLVPFEERDIFKYRGYQRELAERSNADQIIIPQVFLAGNYLGDSKIIEDLNELGRLRKILRPYKRPGAQIPCQKCGGYKLIICNACNGSKKSVHRNRFTETSIPLRCSKCDECGLIQCDLCCMVKADQGAINK